MADRIFISRRGVDAGASSWMAAALEAHGYQCVVQERDFKLGAAFPLSMMEAFEDCETTIAVMSPDYWQSGPCRDEWAAAYALDRAGAGKLIPVMLRPCTPPKLVAALAYLDLTRTGEGEREASLLRAVDAVVTGRASLPDVLEPDTEPLANSSFHTAHFTGRGGELADVHGALWGEGGAAAVTTPAAVHGLGGVGKSAIAREYARRHLHRYAGAWLVRAEQPATLTEDFAALAVRLDPRLAGETNLAALARRGAEEARKLARTTNTPFLILLDNIELPKDVPDYVRARELHVLITTRYGALGSDVAPVEITELPPEAAEALLLETAGREAGEGLAALLEALGGLPLALVQAGAYLRENPSETFAHYLEALERRLDAAPDDWPEDQKLVAATFAPSIERAEASAPGAAALLAHAAFYDPGDIPLALLTDDPEAEPARRAADALARYSLVKPGEASAHGPAISLHRLLQAVLRAGVAGADRSAALQAAAERLAARFSGNPADVRDWPVIAPLAPHATALDSVTPDTDARQALARALNEVALLFKIRAEYAAAEPLYRRALAICEVSLGPDHPEVAKSLNNLASLLEDTGCAAEAEPLYRRALAINEASLGPDHPAVATVLNNLAGLLRATNRAGEAEPLHRRALAIHEARYGPDHPDVATSLNSLALLLLATNRAGEAEPLYRRALAIRMDSLGDDHPDVAQSLNNLAGLLQTTGRAPEAEPLHRRALAIDEASYGPDHPAVATDLNNLAHLLVSTGRLGEALPLARRAHAIFTASLPEGHPHRVQIERELPVLEAMAAAGALDETGEPEWTLAEPALDGATFDGDVLHGHSNGDSVADAAPFAEFRGSTDDTPSPPAPPPPPKKRPWQFWKR